MYALFVLTGLALSALVGRALPSPAGVSPLDRAWLRVAALGGAVVGAYAFELPADLLGWAALDPSSPPGVTLVGGRTVLGGLLGGWAAVEGVKRARRIEGSMGELFALPLATGLAVGRLGCVVSGCCPGVRVDPASPWALVDALLHRAPPRMPATLLEAYVHVGAALGLWLTRDRPWPAGARFAGYVALAALARFVLEFVRENRRILVGLTYYQLLAAALFAVAALRLAWLVRAPVSGSARRR